jgi:hypothetical protein
MNEPGASHIDPGLAGRRVDAYIEAWNEPLAGRRGQILAEVMTDDCTYVDPNTELDGRAGLAGYIGDVLDKQPGRRIERTTEVDVHHRLCRFGWRLVRPDGTVGAESVDFVEFAGDGRISYVAGFFGLLAPREAM